MTARFPLSPSYGKDRQPAVRIGNRKRFDRETFARTRRTLYSSSPNTSSIRLSYRHLRHRSGAAAHERPCCGFPGPI